MDTDELTSEIYNERFMAATQINEVEETMDSTTTKDYVVSQLKYYLIHDMLLAD